MQQLSLPEVEQSDDLPEPGDVVEDANPPSWSQEDTLIVESVADETAGEYVIQESAEWTTIPDKTVADANPSCDQDEPVIEAVYTDNEQGDVYAFPLSRIE